MSDEQQYPEVVIIETDENEWTPSIGWRKVILQMVLRGVVAAGIAMGTVAVMIPFHISSVVLGTIAFAGGAAQGLVISRKLIETTGIVSHALWIVFLATLIGAAFLADAGLGLTSLAEKYHWYWFVYIIGSGWMVSCLRGWMDF